MLPVPHRHRREVVWLLFSGVLYVLLADEATSCVCMSSQNGVSTSSDFVSKRFAGMTYVLLADVAANFLRSMVSAKWRDNSAWGRSEVQNYYRQI